MTHPLYVRNLGLALAATAALVAVKPAAAQTYDEPASISVRFADLDIHHAAGARILLERIRLAAGAACGERPNLRFATQRAAYEQCFATTISQTLKLLDTTQVNAAARRSSGVMPFGEG